MSRLPWVIAITCAAASTGVSAQDPELLKDSGRFMGQWCVECHRGEKPSGHLDLSKFPAGLASPEATLRKAAARLRKGTMPPPKAPQPPRGDVAALLRRIDAAPATPPSPGRVTLRRLSRYEYRCSIRDLFGVAAPTDDFPVDDVGYGFDNVADVLSVSPLLLEKYAAAAEQIAGDAILAEDPDHPPATRVSGRDLACDLPDSIHGSARVLFRNGSAAARVHLPRTGEYLLRVRAWGEQAGPDMAQMVFGADRGAGAGASRMDLTVAATKDAPEIYEIRASLLGGAHKIGVAFTNDFFDPKNPDPSQRDRNLVIEWVEVVGPLDRVEPSRAHRDIFASDPGGPDPSARLHAILPPLILRAWRRPPAEDEVDRLADLGAVAIKDGGRFERAVQLAVQAVLTSPHFLFRIEPDPPGARTAADRPLNGYEIASRLSYFLWSSIPDQRLLDLAKDGRLLGPEVLQREVRRMLDDVRSSALAESFAGQWLELRNLADAAPDPARFPGFDEELRDAMRRETEMLFEAVLRERRGVRELIDADFTFVNERLARHYGIPGVRGTSFRRVAAPPDRGGGILAHASILTITSNATRTSPVKRGKFILDNVLDDPPAPPPPGVGALDERAPFVQGLTISQRLERHRTDPSCSACHARIDGLGFVLEHFDPIGAWRTRDEGAPVDASASRPDGRGPIVGLPGLRDAVREEGTFVRCLAKKLFVYALGRGIGPDDERAIQAMIAALPGPEPTLPDMIEGIVLMEAFRRRAL